MFHERSRSSRRDLIAATSALAAGSLTPRASAGVTQAPGALIDLLRFVEQVQIERYQAFLAAFDDGALQAAGLPAEAGGRLRAILAAEQTHLALLERPRAGVTPASPRPLPATPVAALHDLVAIENSAVAAYATVIPVLARPRLAPTLVGIHSVEARHAAWLATLVGDDPFPDAIDHERSLEEILAALGVPAQGTGAAGTPVAGAPPLAAIAKELGVAPDDLQVVRLERRDWPDSSLGCPQPGQMYAQVITPGYLVEVNVAGEVIEFHADERGNVVRCS